MPAVCAKICYVAIYRSLIGQIRRHFVFLILHERVLPFLGIQGERHFDKSNAWILTWSLPVYRQSIGHWSPETFPGTIQTLKTNSFCVQFQWNTDITKWDWNNLVARSAALVSHILREGRRDFISVRGRRRVAWYILLKLRWPRSENGATKVGWRIITSYIWFRHIRVSLMTCWRAGLSRSSLEVPGGGVLPYISHIGMCHPIG